MHYMKPDDRLGEWHWSELYFSLLRLKVQNQRSCDLWFWAQTHPNFVTDKVNLPVARSLDFFRHVLFSLGKLKFTGPQYPLLIIHNFANISPIENQVSESRVLHVQLVQLYSWGSNKFQLSAVLMLWPFGIFIKFIQVEVVNVSKYLQLPTEVIDQLKIFLDFSKIYFF